MIFLKSILAGLGALVVAAVVAIAVLFGAAFLRAAKDSSGGADFDVVAVHPQPVLTVALVVFAAGFYWQWRQR